MSDVILKVENLSKQYRLGTISTGTISHDLNRWWSRIRGKEDPYLKVGETNDRSSKGESEYVWALKNINFEVKRGEVLGIIGKNGAGKSTLLKILSQVTSPTTGSIKTRGRIASLLEVGTGFHPEMTGRENIFLNGAILGMTKKEIRSKLDEIIEFSGCERYIDTPVKRYSSGMKVRLAFAVAAFLEPDILVVDEVLAVGDAEFQKKAIGKMQDISKGEGRTVLFVSHDMGAVQNLCSRCLVLGDGKLLYNSGVMDAIQNYTLDKSKFVCNPYENNSLKSELYPRFTKISILDSNRTLKQGFQIGEKVIIKIEFNYGLNTNKDYSILWILKNSFNKNVAASSSKILGGLNINESSNIICFEFLTDPLIYGDYHMTFILHEVNGPHYDNVTDLLKINLQPNMKRDNGHKYGDKWEVQTYLKNKWISIES